MKFYEYEYENFDGEKKTLKLRLKSSDMKTIESKTGKALIDYVGEVSITNITNLLMYMSRAEKPNFSAKEADDLFDELASAGITIEEMYMNIIMETLVVSGVMKKEDLENVKQKSVGAKSSTPIENK